MNRRFFWLLCAALVLRIVVAAFPGYPFDRPVFENWARVLATAGPLAIYGRDVVPPVDYPPGYLYVLWAEGIVHARLGGGAIAWRVLDEIVPILGDLAFVTLCYGFARTRVSESRAFAFAAIVALAPPLWIDSAAWGQADAVPIALTFVALLGSLDGRVVSAWSSLAVAVLVKPLAVVVAPIVAVAPFREKTPGRAIAVAAAVSLALAYVATLPFTTVREPVAVLRFLFERYVGGANKAPFLSEGAFSFYPLVAGFNTPDAAFFGPLRYRAWSVLLVALGVAAATATLFRGNGNRGNDLRVLGAASLALLTLFLFATRMHERYVLPAMLVGAPLGIEDRPSALAIAWLACSFTVNCALVVGGFSGSGHHPATLAVARLCSLGNLAAFGILWQRQMNRTRSWRQGDSNS